MPRSPILALALWLISCASPPQGAPRPSKESARQIEYLDRGLVAVPAGANRVFVKLGLRCQGSIMPWLPGA